MNVLDPVILEVSQIALNMARKSTKCPDTQDELHQIAMITIFKIWESTPALPDSERKKIALRSIHNKIADYWRHVSAGKRAAIEYGNIHRREAADLAIPPEEEAPIDDLTAGMEVIAPTLPSPLKELYELRKQGLTVKEAGAKLGVKERCAYKHLRRLKDFLKRGLATNHEK